MPCVGLQCALVQIGKRLEPKIVFIFLPSNLNICFECSKELSHGDGTFEYPQHMFRLRNKNNNFQLHTLIWLLIWDLKQENKQTLIWRPESVIAAFPGHICTHSLFKYIQKKQ